MQLFDNLICAKCDNKLLINDEGKCYYCALMGDKDEPQMMKLKGFPKYEHYEDKFKMNDSVEQPSHYQLLPGIEVKDVRDAVLDAWEGLQPSHAADYGNVIKYILRAPKKSGLEDLKKAHKYLNWLIEGIEG